MAGGRGRRKVHITRSDPMQRQPSSPLDHTSTGQSSQVPPSHSASNDPPTISNSPVTSSPASSNSPTVDGDSQPQRSTNKRQRTRLPRLAMRNPGEKMEVKIDTNGRFVGPYSRELISAIGMWAKQTEHCPLAVDKFDDIPIEKIERFIQLVKDHYVFVEDEGIVQKAILFQVRKSYTNYRHELHVHYLKFESFEYAKTQPHKYVLNKDDWIYLCNYWSSEDFKIISERNKDNRSKQKIGHSNGSVSFAYTKEEAVKKGEDVDRVNMFFRTHKKKKDQSPTDEASRIAMEKMQDLTMQVSQGTASYTPDEIFTKVMGDERHGRVRACGAGPTPTTYFGRQPSRDNHIQEQLDEANTKIVEQAKDIAVMKEQLRILMEQLGGQRNENLQVDEDAQESEDEEDLN